MDAETKAQADRKGGGKKEREPYNHTSTDKERDIERDMKRSTHADRHGGGKEEKERDTR